jgi:hypothetical protein
VERIFLEPWEGAGEIKATTVACFYERQVKKDRKNVARHGNLARYCANEDRI